MRDAFGGAFLIKVFLVFILIYIGFTAVALNYAKAFKVKNKIIEYLETSEISDLNKLNAKQMNALNEFIDNEIIGDMNYNASQYNICSGVKTKNDAGKTIAYCHESGIKIEQSGTAENTKGVYYTVTTYVGWTLPFLNSLLELNSSNEGQGVLSGRWEISGQTRLIVNEK